MLADNASWHKSLQTRAGLADMIVFVIKNLPYSPELNGLAELTIRSLKQIKSHLRLKKN